MERALFRTLLAGFIMLGASSLFAQRVLVLHSFNQSFAWTEQFQKGIKGAADKEGVELFVEMLDSSRFASEEYKQSFAAFLEQKYSALQLNAIVGNSNQACDFLEEYCSFLEDMPRAYYASEALYPDPHTLYLAANYEEVVRQSWLLLRELFPAVREILLIAGDSLVTDSVYAALRRYAADTRITVNIFGNYTFAELNEKIAGLPASTAVFYVPVLGDRNGVASNPRVLLGGLAELSPAPIFTLWETLVGNGSVGGHVISAETTAQVLLKAVQGFLRTGSYASEFSIARCIVDWNAMRRWGLKTSAIPEDAVILNKPLPLYVTHAQEILRVANLALLIFFLALLAAVFLIIGAYRRLRKTNEALKRARAKAEALSVHDYLSGLLNRRGFEPIVRYELTRKKRLANPLCFAIADIDHFKEVNDTRGHDVGDEVLRNTATIIQNNLRSTDTLARWGGEEFAILLPDTDITQATALVERVRAALESACVEAALPIDTTEQGCPAITISLGVAEFKEDEDFDSCFKRADTALLRAKNSGRNKTVAL